MYRKIKRNVLHFEAGVKLEEIYLELGDCRCVIYREFRWDAQSVELKEYNKLPKWYVRQKNVDEVLTDCQEYYAKNKEKMDKYSKEWKQKNKDKWNEYQREYKRKRYQSKKLV